MSATTFDPPSVRTQTTGGPPPPPSRTARLRDAQRAARRHPLAGHAAPWPVTALLWAGAAAGHAGSADTALVVAVAAPVLAVVFWWMWTRRRTRAERRARRWHVLTVTVAAHLWLAWALQAGAGGFRGAALWVGMYLLMAPYWRRRQIPIPPEVPMVLGDENTVPGEGHPVVWKWADRVQCTPGGALPGAYLTGHRSVKNGEAWDINLVPGKQTSGKAIEALPLVVSALDHLTIDQVIIDRHPSGSLARAKLTVIEGHPLNRRLDHPGADKVYDRDTGFAAIGMHPDDEPARWAFEVPGWGVPSGFLVGGTGSGKSTLMENLGAIVLHTGRFAVWAGDPHSGQSFPHLLGHCSWPATTLDEILLQVEAAMALIKARVRINGLLKRALHMPSEDEPGLLLFLDEFHRITAGWEHAKRVTELLSLITREGRKAGVAVIGADQGFDQAGTFGNDGNLRNNIRMKNFWIGRTPSTELKGMATDLEVNPALLPDTFPDGSPTSGLGYLVGKRTAPCRTWYTPDPAELLRGAPRLELEKAGAKFAGAAYRTRYERAELGQAAEAVELAKDDPELMETILEVRPELRHLIETGNVVDTAADAMKAVQPPAADRQPVFHPLTIPAAPRFEYVEPEPEKQTALDVIHDLVRDGVRKKQELMQRSGYADTTVRNALDELMARGDVVKARHGEYEPASTTVAA